MPRWDNAPQAHSRVSNTNFDIWKKLWRGGLYKYSIKNMSSTAKFLPTFVYVKGIARVFNWLKCLGGIMHLKPTAGCQISTLIFGFGRDPMHIPWKITAGRQSSFPLGVYVKCIARAFNWLKCLGGIMHIRPTAGCQISILIFEIKLWRGVSINIP